jgi:hypothetical protein
LLDSPEMEYLARPRVEGNRAVLEHDGARGLAEKVLNRARECFWRHAWHCAAFGTAGSVTSDHRHKKRLGRSEAEAATSMPIWDND